MATHERIRELGRRRGEAAEHRFIDEIREARRSLGMSQAAAATIAGIDRSTWTRIEERRRPVPAWDVAGRMAAAVGLDLRLGLYPSDVRPHDGSQIGQLGALIDTAGPGWEWHNEVSVAPGDPRAWDTVGRFRETGVRLPTELESSLYDVQAMCRRINGKREAAGWPAILLVVKDTPRNRHIARVAADVLVPEFPLAPREALGFIRRGAALHGSSLIFLRPRARPRPQSEGDVAVQHQR
jgi:DNA-binding XRE family transcriptional regulator